MSDNLKITAHDPNAERIDQLGRSHSEKLQQQAKQLVSSLYMLVRSVKMYAPDNQIFDKPLEVLRTTISNIIAADGQLVLQAVKDSFYLNNMLVKMDYGSLDNVRSLIEEMKARKVGGFVLSKPASIDELRNFIWIFSEDHAEVAEDGLVGKKLVNIKVSKWKEIKEKIEDDAEEKVDRKKYAVTVYARAIVFMTEYIRRLRDGEKPPGLRPAQRTVQDLVDICFEQRTHFLGMTTMDAFDNYLAYHSVNTCLISIVFGSELGLTKAQLKELGFIALMHDVGMAKVDAAVVRKRGALTEKERKEVQLAPLHSIRDMLARGALSRSEILRLVTTMEHQEDYGTPVKDSRGNIQMIIPKSNLSVYAKILAIANTYDALTSKRPYRDAYGPEIALTLMWTEMRHKFDPELLKVFMKVMAIQPVRVLPPGQKRVSLG